jgi:hypothetical protein
MKKVGRTTNSTFTIGGGSLHRQFSGSRKFCFHISINDKNAAQRPILIKPIHTRMLK